MYFSFNITYPNDIYEDSFVSRYVKQTSEKNRLNAARCVLFHVLIINMIILIPAVDYF